MNQILLPKQGAKQYPQIAWKSEMDKKVKLVSLGWVWTGKKKKKPVEPI